MSRTADERLQEVLASYGADPRRWPPEERAELAGLLQPASAAHREARALDALLATAGRPDVPAGAEARLMQKLAAPAVSGGNVIAFGAAPRRLDLRWLAALPLAASLALGVYLGARGSLDSIMPTAIVGTMAAAGEDPGDLSGVSDAETYAEDSLS